MAQRYTREGWAGGWGGGEAGEGEGGEVADVENVAAEMSKKGAAARVAEDENGAESEVVRDVSFGKAGDMDAIYQRSERGNYLTSIAANDAEEEDDELSVKALTKTRTAIYNAPQVFQREAAKEADVSPPLPCPSPPHLTLRQLQDVDPFEETRQKTIAEREDEYHARRRNLQISPDRRDPFLEGPIPNPHAPSHLHFELSIPPCIPGPCPCPSPGEVSPCPLLRRRLSHPLQWT